MNIQVFEIKRGRKFDQVIEGAREVFMAHGFEGASVDDIARVSKVSKATLYSYFHDKRLLFLEVFKQECARQAELALEQVHMDGPLDQVLFNAASLMVRFFMSDFSNQIYKMAIAEAERFPEIGMTFYAGGPSIARDALKGYLVEQIQAGTLEIPDIDLATDQFIELCKASHHIQTMLGVKTQYTDAEVDRIIRGAVEVFLARYATK